MPVDAYGSFGGFVLASSGDIDFSPCYSIDPIVQGLPMPVFTRSLLSLFAISLVACSSEGKSVSSATKSGSTTASEGGTAAPAEIESLARSMCACLKDETAKDPMECENRIRPDQGRQRGVIGKRRVDRAQKRVFSRAHGLSSSQRQTV